MPTLGQNIRSALGGSNSGGSMHDASPIDPWTAEAMKLMQFQQQQVAMLRRRRSQMQQDARSKQKFEHWLRKEADQRRRKGAIQEATRIANSISTNELRKKSVPQLLEEFPPGLTQEYAVSALRDVFQTAQQQQSYATTLRQQEAQTQAQDYISNTLKKAGETDEADLSDILTSAFRSSLTDPEIGNLPVHAQSQVRDYFAKQMQSLEYLNEFEKQQLLEKIKSSPETTAKQTAAQMQPSVTGLEKEEGAKMTPEQFAKLRQPAVDALDAKLLELSASDSDKMPGEALRNMRALYEEDSILEALTPNIIQQVWPLMQETAKQKAGMRDIQTFQNMQIQDIYDIGSAKGIDVDAINMAAGFFKSDGSFDTDLWEKHLSQFLGTLKSGAFDEADTKIPPVQQQLLMRNLTYNRMPAEKRAASYHKALEDVYGKRYPEDYITEPEYYIKTPAARPEERYHSYVKNQYQDIFRPYADSVWWKGPSTEDIKSKIAEDITPRERASILRELIKKEAKRARIQRKQKLKDLR